MPLTITASDIVLIAPEMSNSTALLDALIADVELDVLVGQWGSQAAANRAGKYLVAHLATLSRMGGRNVSSESVGGISRSYGQAAGGNLSLASTSYGSMYAQLARRIFGGPRVA